MLYRCHRLASRATLDSIGFAGFGETSKPWVAQITSYAGPTERSSLLAEGIFRWSTSSPFTIQGHIYLDIVCKKFLRSCPLIVFHPHWTTPYPKALQCSPHLSPSIPQRLFSLRAKTRIRTPSQAQSHDPITRSSTGLEVTFAPKRAVPPAYSPNHNTQNEIHEGVLDHNPPSTEPRPRHKSPFTGILKTSSPK